MPPRRSRRLSIEALALEKIHHEEDRPVLGDVVVEHRHRAGVSDVVRGTPLAQEALANLRLGRQLWMQHLDGAALSVAVRARVDRRHAADAEQAIERPLLAKHAPDASLRSDQDRIVQLRRGIIGHLGGRAMLHGRSALGKSGRPVNLPAGARRRRTGIARRAARFAAQSLRRELDEAARHRVCDREEMALHRTTSRTHVKPLGQRVQFTIACGVLRRSAVDEELTLERGLIHR